MTNLTEVRGEGRNDLFGYVSMDMRQPVGNWHASELLWSTLAETYAEGGCELHVHFRAGFVNGGVAGDWCAIFNRREDWLDFINSEALHPERDRSGSEKRNVRQTVLVLDSKLVQLPEGVIGGKSLPSVVRLQSLDNCFRRWIDAPKIAVEFFQRLVATRTENGKFRITFDAFREPSFFIGEGEFKDKIVESGAEVVKTVANDETKFSNRRGCEDFDPKELLGAINIGFTPSSVRVFFAPGVQFRFKALQMVDRPV